MASSSTAAPSPADDPRFGDPAGWAPEALPGVRLLPIVHERVDLAPVVRAVLEAVQPAVVAVELPSTLEAAARRAVQRLPRITAVISEEPGEEPLIWVVTPGDPIVEALRWALDHGRRALFIDPDLRYREQHREAVPDPYSLWTLGPARYLELLAGGLAGSPESSPRGSSGSQTSPRTADAQREAGMAWAIQQAAAEGESVVAVVGAAHVHPLAARLQRPNAQPLARTRRSSVELRHLAPESLTALLVDPPLAHAAYEHLRGGNLAPPPDLAATAAPRVSIRRHGLRLITGEGSDEARERRRSLPLYCAHRARRALTPAPSEIPGVDRRRLTGALWQMAAASYREQTQDALAPWQRRTFFDFSRRYARVQGQLVPGLYEWVVAARGVADDNLAWEIFDAARTYPWQDTADDLPTARIDGEMLDLGTRKVRFRRRFFRVKRRPLRVPVRRREAPDDPSEWLAGFYGTGICSYPPEDLVVEDYGRFLRHKAASILSAENRRTEPFSTSLMDGIDLRETLRHLEQREIHVKVEGRTPAAAGAVVVIFDRDLEAERYPHLMTWHGEHDQESDMAFYSTDPGEQVVGPGILRATYGGFVMTYPPGSLGDVWQDPDYFGAAEKAEVLIMAAVDYSQEKLIAHVAARPPSEAMKRYAALQGKRLVHIPLATLSPQTLKKVRIMHLLAGREKRDLASQYIW